MRVAIVLCNSSTEYDDGDVDNTHGLAAGIVGAIERGVGNEGAVGIKSGAEGCLIVAGKVADIFDIGG